MAMFSPQDRGLENISRTKQDEIDRIFKRLSRVQTQTSLDLSDEQYDGTYACWYWNDTALMENCRAGTCRFYIVMLNLLLRSNLSSLFS